MSVRADLAAARRKYDVSRGKNTRFSRLAYLCLSLDFTEPASGCFSQSLGIPVWGSNSTAHVFRASVVSPAIQALPAFPTGQLYRWSGE